MICNVACGKCAVNVEGEENVNLNDRLHIHGTTKSVTDCLGDVVDVPSINPQQTITAKFELALRLKLSNELFPALSNSVEVKLCRDTSIRERLYNPLKFVPYTLAEFLILKHIDDGLEGERRSVRLCGNGGTTSAEALRFCLGV